MSAVTFLRSPVQNDVTLETPKYLMTVPQCLLRQQRLLLLASQRARLRDSDTHPKANKRVVREHLRSMLKRLMRSGVSKSCPGSVEMLQTFPFGWPE
jgi:hypothetical protein